MIPVLRHLLSDNESLFEYERGEYVSLSRLRNRLIALERQSNIMRNDTFYEGLGDRYIAQYDRFSDLFWKLPSDLAKKYIEKVGGCFYTKLEHNEEWMELVCQIPPSFIIASNFIEIFSNDILLDEKNLSLFVNSNLSQFRYTFQLIPNIPDLRMFVAKEKGLNDLHIHLNGSTEIDVLWNYILNNEFEVFKNFSDDFINNSSVRKHSEQIISDFSPEKLRNRISDAKRIKKLLLKNIGRKILLDNNIYPCTKSYDTIFKNTLNNVCNGNLMQKELLFYLMVMSELRKSSNDYIAGLFHHYLLIKGIIHRFVVMQNTQKGFPQFQLITLNKFRDGIEKYYESRFLQLSTCCNKKYAALIEGRFSPKNTALDNKRIVSNIVHGFERAKIKEKDLMANTKLALIAHFIKQKDDRKSDLEEFRHYRLRKELKKKSIALLNFKNNCPQGNLICGVDAAASEFDASPEVFSHAFRYLRKHGINHFTYHAGEDFRHIISGIRSIVEAVNFLDLHTGDRLGHCTALGISPILWHERIGEECFISQGEWLDNLIFLNYIAKKTNDSHLLSISTRWMNEIAEYSYKVYGKSYPIFILEKAWLLRKYNPFIYLKKSHLSLDSWEDVDNWEVKQEIEKDFTNKDIRRIFRYYHAFDQQNSGYNKLISINPFDVISEDDILFIQYKVLEMLSEKNIVIETLPTSNFRISYYNRIDEYHLDKWLDKDNKRMLPHIVVGTDDPGIFMTNIYNEYSRIYIYLMKKGYSSTCRIQQIEYMHNSSKIYNFVNRED